MAMALADTTAAATAMDTQDTEHTAIATRGLLADPALIAPYHLGYAAPYAFGYHPYAFRPAVAASHQHVSTPAATYGISQLHKREAEAEPEADADADAYYGRYFGGYGYGGYGYGARYGYAGYPYRYGGYGYPYTY